MNLPDFSTSSILVVGDIMLDTYWYGDVVHVSPEAPVPVTKVCKEEVRIGGAGNVAINASSLGASTTFLGIVGDDDEARIMHRILSEHSVNPMLIKDSRVKSTNKLRIISKNQQLIRLDFEDKILSFDKELFLSCFEKALQNCNIVIMSDYAKGSMSLANELISLCNQRNVPTIVDPKGSDFSVYKNSSVITPNLVEFENIVGKCHSVDEIVLKGRKLCHDYNIKAVLITRGENGMTLVEGENDALHLSTRAVEVFDVTGAGDTVAASLATSISTGLSISQSAFIANAAAGLVVSKFGTTPVSISELRETLHRDSNSYRSGIFNMPELKKQFAISHQQNEIIVMTNGCFDILHPGHIDYLKKARLLGDRLVIAVNDDESVKRLKGDDRPINSINDRMLMLTALECVDWVISFSEDSK